MLVNAATGNTVDAPELQEVDTLCAAVRLPVVPLHIIMNSVRLFVEE